MGGRISGFGIAAMIAATAVWGPAAAGAAAKVHDARPGQVVEWNAEKNGDPATYAVGGLKIRMSSRKSADPDNDAPLPVLRVEAPGAKPFEAAGQAGFGVAAADFVVGRLDPKAEGPQIMLASFSGGAHCCTLVTLVERRGGRWRKVDLGEFDPYELALPTDVDGDHIPDLVVYGAFNYVFGPYAEGYSPPVIYNVVGGKVADVSAAPRYAAFTRKVAVEARKACAEHTNSACAAYVAMAARFGEYDPAWRFMLANYDRA